MLQEVSLRGRGSTLHKRFSVWSLMGWSMLNSETVSSCFLILLSFINTFYIFKRGLTFSLLTCENKNVQIFLWPLFDCCVFYINLNDCDITLLWGEVQAVTLFSVSLSGWVLPPASEAVTPSTSRLAAELSPTGPSRCGNSASFTSSAVDRRILRASPRWESFRLKMSPELAVWVSGGKRDRVLRVVVERRLRGVEEDSKQGEELKLFPIAVWKYK